jgi:NADPH:quinone reductase
MQSTSQNYGKKYTLFRSKHLSKWAPVFWPTVRVPDSISCILRSLLTPFHTGITTVTLMTEAHNVQKGEIILVHTVAGGLGLHFTAYAKSRGATVIGTTSTPEKAEIAKSYGADHVILYTKENTVQRVLEITNGEGVHAVFDGVGKDTYVKPSLCPKIWKRCSVAL